MSNKRYDDLIKALTPKHPNPQPGHQVQPGPAYPQSYQPQPPYYAGTAPIAPPAPPPPPPPPPSYRIEPHYYPDPDEPWPMPGPNPPRRSTTEKRGPSGLDLAMVIFAAAMFVIFIAAALPR